MKTYHNPALYEEPRNQPIRITPPIPRESLIGWLESTGRFQVVADDELQEHKALEELDYILEPEGYVLDEEEEEAN